MTNTKMKLLKQIGSLALCLCMILYCLPISAFAETNGEYIHEHTADCGHNYGEEESTETVAPAYTAEDVKALIDALPTVSELEDMDNDELSEVHDKAQEAYDAFETLTDEEQIELADELVKLRDVLDFMTTPVAPLASQETARFTITGNDAVYYWYSSESYWRSYYPIKTISNINVTLDGTTLTISWNGKYQISNYASSGDFESETKTWTYTIENFSCESDVNITLSDYEDTTGLRRTNWTITRGAGHGYTKNFTSIGNDQHKVYCELCSAEKTEDCTFTDGICSICGSYQKAEKNGENYYEISNLGQLCWFADKVNNGETTINGKLMNDIDATSLSSLGIGKDVSHAFAGTFDGNNKTLKIALVSTEQYVAPFPHINGATIKDLTVKGSITTNQKFAASIVGMSEGTTTIENCISYVTIISTVRGDGTHGGFVANVSSGTMTINNCGFVGAINGSNTNNCGGLVGWSNGTTKISNSFVAATFSVSATNGNTFSKDFSKMVLRTIGMGCRLTM